MIDEYVEQSELDVFLLRVKDLIRDYANVLVMSESQRKSVIDDIRDFVRVDGRYPEALGGVWSILCEAAE